MFKLEKLCLNPVDLCDLMNKQTASLVMPLAAWGVDVSSGEVLYSSWFVPERSNHYMLIRYKFWQEPVCCRTSPWRFIWGTTGKMRGCPSPAPTTKAWPLMADWWRRFGSPTCFSSTPSVPSSMTPPQTMSCCGSSQMGKYFIASGKTAFGQCKLLVERESGLIDSSIVFLHDFIQKSIKKNECAGYPQTSKGLYEYI